MAAIFFVNEELSGFSWQGTLVRIVPFIPNKLQAVISDSGFSHVFWSNNFISKCKSWVDDDG